MKAKLTRTFLSEHSWNLNVCIIGLYRSSPFVDEITKISDWTTECWNRYESQTFRTFRFDCFVLLLRFDDDTSWLHLSMHILIWNASLLLLLSSLAVAGDDPPSSWELGEDCCSAGDDIDIDVKIELNFLAQSSIGGSSLHIDFNDSRR